MHFVFVYGTLKRGQPNHYLLQNESNGLREFCGNGKTKTKFPMVVASRYNIPYVLDLPNAGNNIYGEIWRCTFHRFLRKPHKNKVSVELTITC